LSRRLEADLLGLGERLIRVPPKMMARARSTARQAGKSDPIDALAVGRAALREPDLPVAQLDGPSREVRLLIDYRETLVHHRTGLQNQLRWRLHELEPGFDPPAGSLNRYCTLDAIDDLITTHDSMVADLARRETARIRELTREINQLERDIQQRVTDLVPTLLAIPGCGALSAGKLIGEAADITRFKTRDAYAMWAGVAPIPVWSANITRFRLYRGGNRQTNAALHRSRSPKHASTLTHKHSSNDGSKPAQPNEKPSDSSNANSPTSSTEPFSQTPKQPHSPKPLDIGETHMLA
jgi:transposase